MKFIYFLTLLFVSTCASAKSYICIGEAGTAIEHGSTQGIRAEVFNADSKKFVISDESGKWAFKQLGQNSSPFECDTEYFCEIKGGFSGIFMRERESGVFTYIANQVLDKEAKHRVLFTMKGRCSAL